MARSVHRRRLAAGIAALAALGTGGLLLPQAAQARAAAWPARPITLVVSFEPGGSTDLSARVVARELTRLLGQTVNVENRAGAGGRIGTRSVAQARPDGHTLLWGTGSSLTAAPAVKEAFAPLGFVGAASTPAELADRIAQGRARYERIIRERGIKAEGG